MKYVCINKFFVPEAGEDGGVLETETAIEAGTVWEKQESEYSFFGVPDAIRLENEDGYWIELMPEEFSRYFAPEGKQEGK